MVTLIQNEIVYIFCVELRLYIFGCARKTHHLVSLTARAQCTPRRVSFFLSLPKPINPTIHYSAPSLKNYSNRRVCDLTFRKKRHHTQSSKPTAATVRQCSIDTIAAACIVTLHICLRTFISLGDKGQSCRAADQRGLRSPIECTRPLYTQDLECPSRILLRGV